MGRIGSVGDPHIRNQPDAAPITQRTTSSVTNADRSAVSSFVMSVFPQTAIADHGYRHAFQHFRKIRGRCVKPPAVCGDAR